MDFIGELIKGAVLVGHNLDFDWIPTEVEVINASHTGRCNLIFEVRAVVMMYVLVHGRRLLRMCLLQPCVGGRQRKWCLLKGRCQVCTVDYYASSKCSLTGLNVYSVVYKREITKNQYLMIHILINIIKQVY